MVYYRPIYKELSKAEQSDFAKALLFDALKEETGMKECPLIKKTDKGKPFFPDWQELHFNYSHTKYGAACALSDHPVGIDIEEIRPYREKTARKFCCDEEWTLLSSSSNPDSEWIRIWTGKEAYVKCTGTGLRMALSEINTISLAGKEQELSLVSRKLNNSWISVCSYDLWDGRIRIL